MIITPNTILNPNNKRISFYDCNNIAVDSVNVIGKINLADVLIPFDSQLTTRIVLNAGAKNQPLLYGFLGNNITYLLVKATYVDIPHRPRNKNAHLGDNYNEYYRSNDYVTSYNEYFELNPDFEDCTEYYFEIHLKLSDTWIKL